MDQHINQPETFSNDDQQNLLIAEMAIVIDQCTTLIIRSFELNQINVALEAAGKLVRVLLTSKLTPKNYYTVYIAVANSISIISKNIQDSLRFPNDVISELYETVQYDACCMIRLYLMITVAPELCRRSIIRTVDILDDLSDMTRAAQDPIRALFLRHYLLSVFKELLPDSTPEEAEKSAIFLLNNFAQMNRMWVRIEDIMASDERKSQRSEFSSLIGTNIQCIAGLKNISTEVYSTVIFPFLSKHVELCEDALAQEYILRSIITAFAECYHIATVDQLFTIFGKVEQGVKILEIVNSLLEKLQTSASVNESTSGPTAFLTIAKNIEELFNAEGHLSLESKFDTLKRLITFSLKLNPEDVKNIRNLMKFTDFHIDLAISDQPLKTKESSLCLLNLLNAPLSTFKKAEFLYKLEYLPSLIGRLFKEDKLAVAEKICRFF